MKTSIPKRKATKIVKVLFTYKEFKDGGRMLKYDHEKAKEIVKWVGSDYLMDLVRKDL